LKITPAALAVLLLGAVAFAQSRPAAAREASAPCPVSPCPRIVVLDFSLAPRIVETRDENRRLQYSDKTVETEKEVRGWWFGSTDVYFNDGIGKTAADLFSEALRDQAGFNQYSRENLRYYYADKKDVVRDKLGMKDEKELDRAMWTLNPVSVGREVGADKVVVGHICDSEKRRSRAFGYNGTMNAYQVSVYDVRTGRMEYSQEFYGWRGRRSQYGAFEEDAAKFAAGLARFYSGK
jgi:curli biogenesis system outer membrane secretion channel CsgG